MLSRCMRSQIATDRIFFIKQWRADAQKVVVGELYIYKHCSSARYYSITCFVAVCRSHRLDLLPKIHYNPKIKLTSLVSLNNGGNLWLGPGAQYLHEGGLISAQALHALVQLLAQVLFWGPHQSYYHVFEVSAQFGLQVFDDVLCNI